MRTTPTVLNVGQGVPGLSDKHPAHTNSDLVVKVTPTRARPRVAGPKGVEMRSMIVPALLAAVLALTAGCQQMPPLPPGPPRGPSSGFVGENYEFSAVTSSRMPDLVAYRFAWGDADTSDWSEFVPGGIPVRLSHAWTEPGRFQVRAQAKGLLGQESDWGGPSAIGISSSQPDTYPATVRATIPTTDGHPQNLVCPRGTGRAYVPGEWDDAVYVIRTSDNVIIETLRMECGPTHLDCSPDGRYVYIGSFDEIHPTAPDRLYAIRTSDNAVVDSVDLPGCPHGVACLPNGEYIYVSLDDVANKVAVIRTSDFSVVATIPVGSEPRGIVALPNGRFVYVTCTYSNLVYVIRTSDNTVVGTIDAGTGIHRLAVLPGGEYAYVSRYESGAPVMVIRTSDNTVVDSVTVSSGRACGLTALPNGRYVYVTNRDANCVDIIRTSDNTVVTRVGVGSIPYGAASLPDGSGVYTANRGNSVTFIGY
jgi:YVTN family beta-propeller protein